MDNILVAENEKADGSQKLRNTRDKICDLILQVIHEDAAVKYADASLITKHS